MSLKKFHMTALFFFIWIFCTELQSKAMLQPAEAGASLSLTILPHKHSPAELEYDIMSRYYFPCEMGGEIKALLSPGEA